MWKNVLFGGATDQVEQQDSPLVHVQQDDKSKEEEGDLPTPQEALEKFASALNELNVMIDLIKMMDEAKYLWVQSTTKPRTANFLQELADDAALRVGQRKRSLKDAASRVRAGAEALAVVVGREKRFYRELGQLQHYWKIRLNPAGSEAAFSADLSLGKAMGTGKNDPGTLLLPIIKDPAGTLRLQMDAPTSEVPSVLAPSTQGYQGEVHVGAGGVHRALMCHYQDLLWRGLQGLLESEASSTTTQVFLTHLVNLLIQRVRITRDPQLASLRPLMLQTLYEGKLVPSQAKASLEAQYSSSGGHSSSSSRSLLADVGMWLTHTSFRATVRQEADRQVHDYDRVVLRTLPCPKWGSSAFSLELRHHPPILALLRHCSLEVEGVQRPHQGGGQWIKDTHVQHRKQELPHVFRDLMETLGVPKRDQREQEG